jgi:hypothetical protein
MKKKLERVKVHKLNIWGANWKTCKNQKGPTQGWFPKKGKMIP